MKSENVRKMKRRQQAIKKKTEGEKGQEVINKWQRLE